MPPPAFALQLLIFSRTSIHKQVSSTAQSSLKAIDTMHDVLLVHVVFLLLFRCICSVLMRAAATGSIHHIAQVLKPRIYARQIVSTRHYCPSFFAVASLPGRNEDAGLRLLSIISLIIMTTSNKIYVFPILNSVGFVDSKSEISKILLECSFSLFQCPPVVMTHFSR